MRSKKGFTLIEMIVVVGMLAILLTMLIPNIKGFSTASKKQITESNLELLNFSTKSYASFHEIEFRDIFEGTTTDTERMELLIKKGLIESVVAPSDESQIYCWDITNQKWILSSASAKEGCGGSYSSNNEEDGKLTPDNLPSMPPEIDPSAVPTTKPIVTDEQRNCIASGGKYDPVNKMCVCGEGLVLDKTTKLCIGVPQYLCTESGGTYDDTTKACACPVGSELNETQTMCIGIKLEEGDPKRKACIESNGTWNEEAKKCVCPDGYYMNSTTNACEYKFFLDSDNPNYWLAANKLNTGSVTDENRFDVLYTSVPTLQALIDKAKEQPAGYKVTKGDYMIYNQNLYIATYDLTIGKVSSADDFMSSGDGYLYYNLNMPIYDMNPRETVYHPIFVRYKNVWYQPILKIPNFTSGPPDAPGAEKNWNKCGVTLEDVQNSVCIIK